MGVRNKTKEDVIAYIREHAKDGKLTASLVEIAGQLGYSNATVFRALRALEEQGIVKIIPADKPTKPNTIVWRGFADSDELVQRGRELAERLEEVAQMLSALARDFAHYVQDLQEKKTKKEEEQEPLPGTIHIRGIPEHLYGRVVDTIEMPDGRHYMLMIRKDDLAQEQKQKAHVEKAQEEVNPES